MCRETESLARLRHAAVTLLSSIIFYTDAIIRVVIFTQIESDKSITVFISFETHHLDWKVSFFPFSYIFEIERSFPRFAGSKNHRPVHAKRRVNKKLWRLQLFSGTFPFFLPVSWILTESFGGGVDCRRGRTSSSCVKGAHSQEVLSVSLQATDIDRRLIARHPHFAHRFWLGVILPIHHLHSWGNDEREREREMRERGRTDSGRLNEQEDRVKG